MSELGKHALGLKGFPTPDDATGEDAYLLFLFSDPTWAQWILGALIPLVYEYNWYKSGGLEPEEASELFRVIIQQAPYNLLPVEDVPTPWWNEDSGDDADDSAPKDMQPWYGEIVIIDDRLTFVENAFIYVVAGFIAYAGLPSAAISFIPLARQFVVTAKSNPLGGIIRFLADAVEIGRVDTYSASDGVVSTSLLMPPPTMGLRAEDVTYPVLWAELLPDNPHDLPSVSMTIIRSRLSEADVTGDPTKIRFDTDCGCIQTSSDGGVTWSDDPSADPRYGMSFIKPPLGGGTAQCDAAANRVKWIRDFIDALVAALELAGTAFTLANIALEFFELLFAEAGLITELLIEFGATVFSVGGSALDAAFDTSVYDELLCLFLCYCLPDGSVNAAEFDSLAAAVSASGINTTAKDVLALIFGAQGYVGVNNAGVIGGQTGDCSGCSTCEWIFEYDFTVSNYGIDLPFGNDGANDRGHWVPGTGFVGSKAASHNDVQLLMINCNWGGLHITETEAYQISFHGSGIGNGSRGFNVTDCSPITSTVLYTEALPTQTTYDWVSYGYAADTVEGWGADWFCDSNGTGYVTIAKYRLHGTGAMPPDGTRIA